MRIIISTKYLASTIKEAILNGCKQLNLIPHTSEIVFSRLSGVVASDIHILERGVQELETYSFNPIQMYKLMIFLESLLEQPIVVEFDQFTDSECSIKLTQFEHRF